STAGAARATSRGCASAGVTADACKASTVPGAARVGAVVFLALAGAIGEAAAGGNGVAGGFCLFGGVVASSPPSLAGSAIGMGDNVAGGSIAIGAAVGGA